MFYLPTPGGREETSFPAVRMQSRLFLNGQHVLATIWPQFKQFSTENKHGFTQVCKILKCWKVKQLPHDW